MNTNKLEKFIERQKIYFDHIKSYTKRNNVLRLRYEELIFDYENQLKVKSDFLDIDPKKHINKLKIFNPELSKKMLVYGKEETKKSIKEIEINLKHFCYK